jgi:hypothetical protein
MNMNKTGVALAAMACLLAANQVHAQIQTVPAVDNETLLRIRDAAMGSDYAYQRLTDLTDLVGPRLSGSPGAAAAVDMVSAEMKKIGMNVKLQPVKVPHWVRGAETAELVDYAGRPAGITQKLVLTALGGSDATPAAGITAPVLLVHDMEELNAHKDQARGAIVVFDVPFNEQLAQAGRAGNAYGEAGMYRFVGPAKASQYGAAAALVRSVGGANYRVTHTGMTGWIQGAKPIPAGALTAEDAMLIDRLAARGPLKMHLTMTPQTLPDADSADVLADIPGSDKADEVVLVSGHLDSWDLAQGATDDGAGVTVAMGVAEVFKRLGLKPRRTVRMVAWMNEENGQRGEKGYFDANRDKMGKHFAAIETDAGATHPIGIMTSVVHEDLKAFDALKSALRSIGAPVIDHHDRLGTGDLSMIEDAGVPCFEPLLDVRTYFDYHHTPADTLDKVDSLEMKKQVAVLAMLTWYLANMPEDLTRLPAGGKAFDD